MRSNGKLLRLLLCTALLLVVAGCSGISASPSVSPGSFFLPGLMQADPPPAYPNQTLPAEPPANQLALN